MKHSGDVSRARLTKLQVAVVNSASGSSSMSSSDMEKKGAVIKVT